ncbi:MAG: hypothetical protein AAF597_12180, partial [Bacteroidota bacterium]
MHKPQVYFTLLFILTLCTCVRAQNFSSQDPAYIEGVTAGEAALKAEDYAECLEHYAAAFKIKTTSFLSTMRAAACAHSAGEMELRDKYLNHAFSLDAAGATNVFKAYEEFAYLYDGPFAEAVDERFMDAFPDYDKALADKLAEVRRTDQEQRGHMREYSDKYGWKSPQMDSLWSLQNYSDSV